MRNDQILVLDKPRSLVVNSEAIEKLKNNDFDVKNYVPENLRQNVHPAILSGQGKQRLLLEGNPLSNSQLFKSLKEGGDFAFVAEYEDFILQAKHQNISKNSIVYVDVSNHEIYDHTGYPLRRSVRISNVPSDLYDLEEMQKILAERDDIELLKDRYGQIITQTPTYDRDSEPSYSLSFIWKPSPEDWDKMVELTKVDPEFRIESMFNIFTIIGKYDLLGVEEACRLPDEPETPSP